MPYIVAYQKASDDHTTYELRGPEGADSQRLANELNGRQAVMVR